MVKDGTSAGVDYKIVPEKAEEVCVSWSEVALGVEKLRKGGEEDGFK